MFAGSGVLLGALLATLSSPAAALICLGRESLVNIYPSSDITILYGSPLEIYCSVEPPYNSSVLRMSQRPHNSKIDIVTLDPQIVNETTVRLYIPRPERQSSMYECEIRNGTGMHYCFNNVVVDKAPDNCTDFYCRSYSLQRLECRWRPPVHYINTEYTLSYEMYGHTTYCTVHRKGDTFSCVFGGVNNSNSVYRNQEEYYIFNLTSRSRFGDNAQTIKVDHFAVLIPDKPTNLKKENITAHSVLLQWQIPRDIADFSPGVNHSIKYQIKTVDNLTTWRLADLKGLRNFNKTTYLYKLQGLPYAHWSYDVRIFIKSVKAPDEEEFWSKFEATTFTTLSERPPRPPRTVVGAFEAKKRDSSSRDIFIYWQQIDDFDESGENFTYQVILGDTPFQSNKSSYAHFTTSLSAVNISISSVNNYGSSSEKSYIYVPAESDMLREPTSFTKTVFGNKTYDLRWYPPADTNFDSYTVFWCYNTDSEQCSGRLNFTKLSPSKTSYRVMVPEDDKTYLFAISANRGELSSGMVWAYCNLPAENAKNKVAVFKRGPAGRRSVELEWSLGCSFSEGHVKGYRITYCLSREVLHCSDTDDPFVIIDNPLQTNISVSGLMPYSTYSFRIAVIYKDGIGYDSENVDASTLEDKPSEPVNLMISNVNASSMKVSWDPPALKNGVLLEYLVRYRIDNDPDTEKEVKQHVRDKRMQDERQEITLTGLQPFTNYTVQVLACTTDCSVAATAGQVRTAIGAPSGLKKPELNISTQRLNWTSPRIPGGTLDLYQIRILDKDNNVIQPIINITNTGRLEHDVPLCDLTNAEPLTLYYSVRAINYDEDKEHGVKVISGNVIQSYENETWAGTTYESEWSPPENMNCGKTTSAIIFWILGIVTIIVFMIMFVLGSRKVWIRFKTMTDIGPVLPPGLGPIDEKDSKYQLGGSWSPPGKNKEEKSFPAVAGDEVLLLPPPRRVGDTKDFSDSTESTTVSLNSKEPREQDAATSDEASDNSSIHVVTTAEPTPQPQGASSGYKTFATQPAVQDYHDDYYNDADSTCSDVSDTALPSGYVQPSILAQPTPCLDIPSGYVRAQDATPQQFASPSVSFPPLAPTPKPTVQENPLMPKFLPMEWKLAPERGGGQIGSKLATNCAPLAPVKPSGGYVSHADAVINKHLNIISNNHLGEEPALPDPNMSPEAYCRFAWNPDPSADNNLHSLLSDQVPTAPAQSLFVLQAPKD